MSRSTGEVGTGAEASPAADERALERWTGGVHHVESVVSGLGELPDKSVHAVLAAPSDGLAESYRTRGVEDEDTDANDTRGWERACFRVLRPGGHMAVFAGPRTFHREWARAEDAGFEIRDTLAVPHERRGHREQDGGARDTPFRSSTALSLVGIARRPLPSTSSVAENLLEYGTGALNIAPSRVPIGDSGGDDALSLDTAHPEASGVGGNGKGETASADERNEGRYPSTVFFDQLTANHLDERNGVTVSSGGRAYHNTNDMYSSGWAIEEGQKRDPGFGDRGGPSRFFHVLPSTADVFSDGGGDGAGSGTGAGDADEVHYSRATLARWLVRLFTRSEQVVVEPFAPVVKGSAPEKPGSVRGACEVDDRWYIGFVPAARGDEGDEDG